jgi:serine/threonine protein kinase
VLQQAGLKDFEFKTVLGEGAFGKVFLGKFKESGNFYAIKAFRKDILIKKKQIKMAEDEVEIMSKL